MYVWGAAQRGTPVQINVIGTVMFLASVLIVLGAQTVSARRAQRVA
jgi:spermidine/putrescine transport system permease protein